MRKRYLFAALFLAIIVYVLNMCVIGTSPEMAAQMRLFHSMDDAAEGTAREGMEKSAQTQAELHVLSFQLGPAAAPSSPIVLFAPCDDVAHGRKEWAGKYITLIVLPPTAQGPATADQAEDVQEQLSQKMKRPVHIWTADQIRENNYTMEFLSWRELTALRSLALTEANAH